MSIISPRSSRGFTIVELLIVIVVIAILAAITIMAYNGIQQRGRNSAIIDAASKSLRIIQAYIAENGSYPISAGSACITTESGCFTTAAVAANINFDTNIAKIGSVPRSVPNSGDTYYGIYITYASTSYNGDPQPLFMTYLLNGVSQQCGLSRVTAYVHPAFTPSSAGYTSGNLSGTGKTLCWVSIPGPAT